MLAGALLAAGMIGLGSAPAEAVAAPPDIATAPTQIAHTALGDVGYRQVGQGPPLVMITGFSAGMDDWAPYLVDALATHFRVIVFDNAGIGDTATLAAPLTVPEMADQTAALISTLGLGRADVLGWSMGGLIAQSLAVTHPGQVHRLVLAATQAGTGKRHRCRPPPRPRSTVAVQRRSSACCSRPTRWRRRSATSPGS